MPEIEINIDVYCEKCKAGLCNQTTTQRRRGTNVFYVEPCEKCLEEARDAGYDEGLTAGMALAAEEAEDAEDAEKT